MKTGTNHTHHCIITWFLFLVFSLICFTSTAQTPTDTLPDDPGITVYTLQNMSFGAFHPGAGGGTVTINTAGARSAAGSVVLLNLGIAFFQSIFELEAPVGTIISILNGPDATLSGSNGGTMSLHLENSQPVSPFYITVPSPGRTQVSVSGTLNVGGPLITIPGTYTGNFFITFNQE